MHQETELLIPIGDTMKYRIGIGPMLFHLFQYNFETLYVCITSYIKREVVKYKNSSLWWRTGYTRITHMYVYTLFCQ